MPDLVAFVGRDGIISKHLGGRQVLSVANLTELTGRRLDEVWPQPIAKLLLQMVRRALSDRVPVEDQYTADEHSYEVRIRPQGRERVLCVIRELANVVRSGADQVDRRGFEQRMNQSIASGILRERQVSLGIIHLGAIADIGQSLDFTIADQLMTLALGRLPSTLPATSNDSSPNPSWYVGQLGDGFVAVVVADAPEREQVRHIIQMLCNSFAEPLSIGDASFYLAPCAGIAILGEDALKPTSLLEAARAALAEARRQGPGSLQFYSDTVRKLPKIRLDLQRELRQAIASDQIELHYFGRHNLASGQLEAVQAYLRWRHPLRGEVLPSEFIPIASSTGLAVSISRYALMRLSIDAPNIDRRLGAAVKVSFAPLRHHLMADEFLTDLDAFYQSCGLAPDRFELRIAEKSLTSLGKAEGIIGQIAGLGTAVMVDEFGCGFSSLARLAQLPLKGLQIDRRFVLAAAKRTSALRFCKGAMSLARSYGLIPIASGVDTEAVRQLLIGLGCEQGIGDHFARLELKEPLVKKMASA